MRAGFPLSSATTMNASAVTRFSAPLLMLLAILIWAHPSVAATYYVGSCKTGSYPTISEAVKQVPAGSTIKICPGTYAEALLIQKPLTLQGMRVGTSSQVIIQPPGVGSALDSIKFGVVSPIIFADTGPVNLSDIIIAKTACPTSLPLVDIFYSNAYGTINHVTTQTSYCKAVDEIAILLENGTSTATTTTVENSNIWEPQDYGIYACSTPSRSVVNVKDNYVYYVTNLGVTFDCNTAGTATGNFGETAGLATFAPGSVFSGNTLTQGVYGIYVSATGAKVESNRIYNSGWPVFLYSDGATVTGNKFMGGGPLNFNCFTATVSGNTFVAGSIQGIGVGGYQNAPASFKSSDMLFNVGTEYYGSCP